MSEIKISQMPELINPANEDVIPVIDVDAPEVTQLNKKIKVENLLKGVKTLITNLSTLVTGINTRLAQLEEEVPVELAEKASKDSPDFTGNPKAPTAPLGDSSKSIATTEYVQQNKGGGTAYCLDSISGQIEEAENKEYILDLSAATTYKIMSITVKAREGTCDMLWGVNDQPLLFDNTNPINVSTTVSKKIVTVTQEGVINYAGVVQPLSKFSAVVSNNNSAKDISFSVEIHKSCMPEVF